MKTYIVEDSEEGHIVLGYYEKLSDAKREAKRHAESYVTMLDGPYFGEGFHKYKLLWDGQSFSYIFR